jgi:hypothetical protein
MFGGATLGIGTLANPCASDGRHWFAPVIIGDTASLPRGRLRGLLEPLHTAFTLPWRAQIPDIAGLPEAVLAMRGGVNFAGGNLMIDLSGETW